MDDTRFVFSFLKNIKRTIELHKLFKAGERVLVGVSGGADSVCLLHALHRLASEYGITLFAVHVNHCLRAGQSDADQDFTAALCARLGVPFFAKRVSVAEHAAAIKQSVEAAAHHLRYDAFFSLAKDMHLDKIAIAHNKNDNAETVLAAMLRGSGTRGRSGLAPKRPDGIVRPLIEIPRADIERFLAVIGETYVTDCTNSQMCCTRNKLRAELIPHLAEHYNPNIVDTLARTAVLSAADEDYMDTIARQAAQGLLGINDDDVTLSVSELLSLHRAIAARVVRIAAGQVIPGGERGVSFDAVARCMRLACSVCGGGAEDIGGGAVVVREHRLVRFMPKQSKPLSQDGCKSDYCYVLEPDGTVFVPEADVVFSAELRKSAPQKDFLDHKKEKDTESFDYNLIKGKIYIRNRKPGDLFSPYGNRGTKKLGDYFTDTKVTPSQRDSIPLVCDDDHILWAAGYRRSAHACVNETTEQILTIRFSVKRGDNHA